MHHVKFRKIGDREEEEEKGQPKAKMAKVTETVWDMSGPSPLSSSVLRKISPSALYPARFTYNQRNTAYKSGHLW